MNYNSFDKIIKLKTGTLVQQGNNNNRIYLIKLSEKEDDNFPETLILKAKKYKYTKIIVKIPKNKEDNFLKFDFKKEASIPKLYKGKEEGVFLAYYLDDNRKIETEKAKSLYDKNLFISLNKTNALNKQLNSKFKIRKCNPNDIDKMIEVYKIVFPTYPFPIHDGKYLLNTMKKNVDYYCVEYNNKIISLSSSEIDKKNFNTEMTDFASLPGYRGNSLAFYLLKTMEFEAKKIHILCSYTIARAASVGMNITFSKSSYIYTGRLINNTNILGNIESMNVWYKSLI
jgi:beta-lysine N6-acetyltransferase